MKPTFEQCAFVAASYIVANDWPGAVTCAKANQRTSGFDEHKLLDRAKEIAARDGVRFTDMSGAYQVVAEMLEYFDSYKLATWAPLAAIIERERKVLLKAMRDPTEDMVRAGERAMSAALDAEGSIPPEQLIWQAMLRAVEQVS